LGRLGSQHPVRTVYCCCRWGEEALGARRRTWPLLATMSAGSGHLQRRALAGATLEMVDTEAGGPVLSCAGLVITHGRVINASRSARVILAVRPPETIVARDALATQGPVASCPHAAGPRSTEANQNASSLPRPVATAAGAVQPDTGWNPAANPMAWPCASRRSISLVSEMNGATALGPKHSRDLLTGDASFRGEPVVRHRRSARSRRRHGDHEPSAVRWVEAIVRRGCPTPPGGSTPGYRLRPIERRVPMQADPIDALRT